MGRTLKKPEDSTSSLHGSGKTIPRPPGKGKSFQPNMRTSAGKTLYVPPQHGAALSSSAHTSAMSEDDSSSSELSEGTVSSFCYNVPTRSSATYTREEEEESDEGEANVSQVGDLGHQANAFTGGKASIAPCQWDGSFKASRDGFGYYNDISAR